MSLQVAQWKDILPILKDNFSIWSPGLTQSDYRIFISSQLKDRWLSRHFRYLVYKVDGKVAASCKVYDLDFVAKKQSLKFVCIGAVYTQTELRGRGFASQMLYSVVDDCKVRSIDGLMLFSAIDPRFYEVFGFREVGGFDVIIHLPEQKTDLNNATAPNVDDAARHCGFDVELNKDKVIQLARYHQRWLSRQPYGIKRSEEYFLFKIAKERFLSAHSRLNRPELKVLSCTGLKNEFAYAIIEVAASTMRVLEVVGSETGRMETWSQLFNLAKALNLRRIRGWESLVADCAPGFTNCVSMPSDKGEIGKPKIECYERDWGKPMILPISKTACELSDVWLSSFPCPLLELDHF